MLFKALNNKEKDKAERSYIYSHTTKHLKFTVKSKRSQSALEYMMTYGWAILIIVIVAVILYSMGIFNPSSSVTFTSSGFSPFTISSSLCNNLGYKIAIIAGPIPNNANYITINKVFVTSATGANTTTASYTLTNPVTLKSGQSATILIPNVACTAAKVHYSLSAKIQYSYTASTLGLQTINTTGTVAGTSISGKPSTLTTYEPITIMNTQSSATPSPFQQMVNFTSSDPGFSSIATGNFGQNVEFFYYNGTIIPSWLENYTSTNAIWWLKIAAISGGSSETVYVGFAPTLTNLFNTVNDGEAPQLTCPNPSDTTSCSTYAEYDDGAGVFNYYNDFSGTTLTNFLITGSSGYTITVDNGLFIQGGSSNAYGIYLPSNYNFTKNSIFSFYITGVSMVSSNYWIGGGISSSESSGGTAYIRYGGLAQDFGYGVPTFGNGVQYGNTLISTSSSSTTVGDTMGLNSIYDINSTYLETVNPTGTALWELPGGTNEKLEPPFYWEIGGWNSAAGDELNVSYTYIRSLPPNAAMPSVSFGSVA
ncbi:hypothetical protein M1384_02550 [Candidatus Parvarchaeota archaeon]|jgi:hypothetical protein|nr:hypothetical protein [Candidatus Parvarchaeota archaeon]